MSVYLNPLVYVVFIALLPLETHTYPDALSGLATGLAMDLTMGAAGVNTIATVFVAFVRIHLLNFVCGKENVHDGGVPSASDGWGGRPSRLPDRDGRPPPRRFSAWRPFRGRTLFHDAASGWRERCRVGGLHLGHRPHLHRQTPRPHMKSSEGFVRMRTCKGWCCSIFGVITYGWPTSSLSIRNTTNWPRQCAAPCGAVPAARRGVRP